MGKRFIDSKLWSDAWFRRLPKEVKLFWIYLFSACDNAGVWQVDFEMATFVLGFDVTPEFKDAINEGKERITPIKSGRYWFIEEFLEFQYGLLKHSCYPHRRVKKLLTEHGISLEGRLFTTLEEEEEEEEDKEEEEDLGKDPKKTPFKNGVFQPPTLEDCIAAFREKGYSPAEAGKFWNHYEARGWMMGKNKMKKWRAAVATWISQGKQFGTLEKLPPPKVETRLPEKPDILLSDSERKKLIQSALPTYGKKEAV